MELMEKARPILYDEQGIPWDTGGRKLNLMKLMNHLMKRLKVISGKLKGVSGRGITGIKSLSKEFSKAMTHYRFFAKDMVTKTEMIQKAMAISEQGLERLTHFLPGRGAFDRLQKRAQEEILRLLTLGPELMDQIGYWLRTHKVAPDKIISLWKMIPKAIPKGKIGKPVEFGRKWIVNAYRGGYVLVFAPANPKIGDQNCVIESLSLHKAVFDEMPRTYGTDRGMYSTQNLELCMSAGIKKIAIQPKGKAKPIISLRDHRLLANRRVAVEARIAHMKLKGLGKSRMKTDLGDLISGYRSALACNLGHLMRDLTLQPMGGRS
jgi:hypothetical protein